MAPEHTIWAIDADTSAKHQVLRGYMDAWFPIMGTTNPKLVVIDAFAGPGRYEGGEAGSPILMLESLRQHAARNTITAEVIFFFIEEDAARAESLRREVAALEIKASENITVQIEEGLFHERVGEVLDDIDRRGARLAPTFAFIDPFGYKANRIALSSRILGFKKCEVLMYVPLPFMARFLNGKGVPVDAFDHLFGDDRWRAAQGQSSQREGERILHDLLIQRLREDCAYVRSFEIVGSGPKQGATLFFGTNHPMGLRRMKESMWKTDPGEGSTFRDTTSAGQITLFARSPDFRALERMLVEHFGTDPFSIDEAERHVLESTPFLETHLKRRTLAPAERAARLEPVKADPKRKKCTYPAGTLVRFV